MPDAAYYGDMAQLENGVGMTALLEEQFREALAAAPGGGPPPGGQPSAYRHRPAGRADSEPSG